MPTPFVIAPVGEEDRDAVRALLRVHGLPTAGLDDSHVVAFVARQGGDVVGSAAIEVYGPDGLLRSVAVSPSWRGAGVGSALTAHAIAEARARGLGTLYLLTETAAGFFPRFGFAAVARADVPSAIAASIEFTTACPASALVLMLRL